MYDWKIAWSASMAIEMGCCAMALTSAVSEFVGTSVKDVIVETDGTFLHVPSAALYGYDASEPRLWGGGRDRGGEGGKSVGRLHDARAQGPRMGDGAGASRQLARRAARGARTHPLFVMMYWKP